MKENTLALKIWIHPIVLVLSPNCQLTLCPIEANNAWKAYYHHLTVRESKSVSVQILPGILPQVNAFARPTGLEILKITV